MKHLFSLKQQGILLINGPVMDHAEIRGVGIYDCKDIEEARALALQDPAVVAGRLSVQAYPWFGIPGAVLK